MAIVEPWTPGEGQHAPDVISNGHPEAWSGGGAADAVGRRLGPVGRRIALALTVLVALSGVIWFADRQVARSQFAAVIRCVQISEHTIDGVDGRLATIAKYVGPRVGPQSSLLIRDNLYRLIENAAEEVLPDLDVALTGCDQVSIAPLYHHLGAARTAYVGYLTAQMSHLRDISRDGTAELRPAPELPPLLVAARTALSAAAPDRRDRTEVAALLRSA